MHDKDIIPMKRREAERLRIIQKVIDKEITQVEGGRRLGLSERQVRRLVKRVQADGAAGIVHLGRGRKSLRRLSEGLKRKVLWLVRSKYDDYGPTLAAETLAEKKEAVVSRETLRQWMKEEGLWRARKRTREVHSWRERRAHRGEMVQMDGSHHDWLEGRGPKMVLMGYIDDANNVTFGRFYDYEGVYPAMDSLRRYFQLYGRPESLYFDRHSTYKTTRQANTEELLEGKKAQTQFERALEELEVKAIHAHSPQAKGRIERSFRTLQDRLVKAMRLEKISTLDEANRFLEGYWPKYNAKFAKEPRAKQDYHRPMPKTMNLERIFCLKEGRSINPGYVIKWDNRVFIVVSPSRTMLRQKATVLESFDGQIEVLWRGRPLAVREVNELPRKNPPQPHPSARPKRKGGYVPRPDHPWRRNDPSLHYNVYLERIGSLG